jgi:hypothetical protein
MLIQAARRTPSIRAEPEPFVLQRSLGDFAVNYEINAYTDEPRRILATYSDLHRNILDVFNEFGVQIMTPAYEGDPEQAKVVPRDQWYMSPAVAPISSARACRRELGGGRAGGCLARDTSDGEGSTVPACPTKKA